MTDKERYGFDVEKEMRHLKGIVEKNESITISNRFTRYLIEQAEKNITCQEVLELRKDALKGLIEQNKRYREALEFYATRYNYKLEHFDPNLNDYMSIVDYDEGEKARKALESESE